MDTNTVHLVEKFGDKMDQYFQALADKAGVATDHFWPIFVKQQYIEGISLLVLLMIGFIACVLLFRMGINHVENFDSRNYPKSTPKVLIGFIAGTILSAIVFIGFATEGSATIGKIINPEYYAVQSLVQMVK